jgi:hypothetical protein
LCDAFQVPKPLSPQLLSFGKSDDDLGELTFGVGLFFCSVRKGRTVRVGTADGPRGASSSRVFSCSCLASLSIRRGFEFSLGEVSDSPQQWADGPRVPGGQSARSPRTVRYSGSSLVVRLAFSDGPRRRAGQSVVWVRTVHQSLCALLLGSIPPFLSRASACASRNRS